MNKITCFIFAIIIACCTACSSSGSSDNADSNADSNSTSIEITQTKTNKPDTTQTSQSYTSEQNISIPMSGDVEFDQIAMPAYIPVSTAPKSVSIGMKVSEALMVPGATQSVSAIMTGGQITGTVVIQWNGKSYYTNVDFAQEGNYAFGTRYTEPEDIASFIEVACSEAAVPSDFTDKAIVTEQIR